MDTPLLKILLVDDDEDDYIITQDLLSEIDGTTIELEWVSTYDGGVEKSIQKCHDVYIFDYNLGSKTGLELLQEVLASGCPGPIILLTGQGDHEIDVKAMEAGAADYLVKGKIDASMLERSIRYALENSQSKDQIKQMAYFDSLTNLPNRILFQDRLQQGMALAHRYHRNTAVMFLDLDNFKRINDTLGHNVGDQLLQGVAERFNECIRDSDCVARHKSFSPDTTTIARLGGDEFTLLLTEINHPHDAAKVADRLLKVLENPFILEGQEVVVTASIGIAIYPHDGDHKDALLKNADTAMYYAKERGKNNYQFYRNRMNAAALDKLTLENDLHKALNRGEFSLHYQPQIDIRNGEIFGVEALLRWQHPERGMVPPAQFIPIAEEVGLIIPIGEWVIHTACSQNKVWQKSGFPPFAVSVNLSTKQFQQKDLFTIVSNSLEDAGLSPQHLILEVTESSLVEHSESVESMVRNLTEMGIRLSMDDFGTGYSSLSYLKRFPIYALKIDQSFIRDITTDPDDAAIAATIIAMAHNLHLDVIAEGVETEEQLEFLHNNGCYKIQGYLLSRPKPADEISVFLAKAKEGTAFDQKYLRK